MRKFSTLQHKKATHTVRWVCGLLFLAFVLTFLMAFQSDALGVTQHLLSDGTTVYGRIWGGLVLTALACLITWCYSRIVTIPTRFYALVYFPAAFLLGLLTSVVSDGTGALVSRVTMSQVLIYLGVYLLILWGVMHYPDHNRERLDLKAYLSCNVLVLCLLFVMTCQLATTDAAYHYTQKVRRLVTEGQYDEALTVGVSSATATHDLTAYRIYALSRTGKLGDVLFAYPQYYGSEAMLPTSADTLYKVRITDEIYRHIGAVRGPGISSALQYLQLVNAREKAGDVARHYLLCAYLLDKKLDAFVELLQQTAWEESSLPRHYREALFLYRYLNGEATGQEAQDTSWQQFLELTDGLKDDVSSANRSFKMFPASYWWYYFYR